MKGVFRIGNKKDKIAGFTLLEMLIVIVIISILLVVVLFNYRDVESKSVLKNIAYEVALSIREAQSLGLGVKKYVPDSGIINPGTGVFNQPYGIHVNDGAVEAKSIYLFSDVNEDGICDNCTGGACPGTGECRQVLGLHSGAEIQNICLKGLEGGSTSSLAEECINPKPGVTGSSFYSAAVRFKRPNPDARFTAGNQDGSVNTSVTNAISNGGTMVISLVNQRSPDYIQNIEITSLGQLSVYGEDI